MKTEIITKNGRSAAVVYSDTQVIADTASTLDWMMTVKQETGCTALALNKEAIAENFFILSTCLAGEILQKFINYGMKFAIYGDFSGYTSKPLRDFIYESNQGRDIFFQPTAELAAEKLLSS